jgi:TolB-like protein/Tfp pilus assembly protein PilF
MNDFLQRLKQRKLVQWALAYVAAAFALLQGIDIVAQQFDWPQGVRRGLTLALVVGFLVSLVLAWYLGERGAQRVTTTELLILALLLALGGGFLWRFSGASRETNVASSSAVAIAKKSIAVLPFENLSAEKENAYFVDGIQDEILTRLAKISALKVISRTSTMRYASRPDDLREIARQLGVANILEGSVQRAAGAVRVNVQLIEAETDSHLWAESYDRDIKNIFSVESEVAQAVADALKAKLLPEEAARVANVPTTNSEAHDLFLKAEYFANQITAANVSDPVETVQRAAALYERAIAADPEFALAYARLSYLRSRSWWYNFDPSPKALEVAESAARKALALQPELGEAHLSMGLTHYWGHRDYALALAEFAIAQKSLPNSATVEAAIGFVQRRQWKMAEAMRRFERATVLDPRDNQLPREIAYTLLYTRHYSEAAPAFERALAIVPDDHESQVGQVSALIMNGDLKAAREKLDAMPPEADVEGSASLARWQLALANHQPDQALAALEHAPAWLLDIFPSSRQPVSLPRAQALLQKGDAEAARVAFLEAKKELEALSGNPRVEGDRQSYLALTYVGLGDKQAALTAGRRATALLPISRDVMIGGAYLTQLAMTEAQVGEKDAALTHIEQVLDAPAGNALSIALLRLDPRWDPIRNDPRFQALVAKYSADGKTAER